MKPISLCLVQMGKKGLELVENYPKKLPEAILNEIVLKSMPLGAKEGDFATHNIDNCNFSGYVFTLPGNERKNVASLVAVFDHPNYNLVLLRNFFVYTVTELRKKSIININIIAEILPSLYRGLIEGHLKIKISSVVTLEFDFKTDESESSDAEESISSLKDEMW